MTYSVTVTRVNEGEHQKEEEVFSDVVSVNVSNKGSVDVSMEDGRSSSFGATSWGSVTIARVEGR